jgi:Fuc2NAc and GlcNAc transferase
VHADHLILLLAAPVSWLLILLTRRYVTSRGILDIPSVRSSHSTPTPRGGGLGIVTVTILGVLAGGAAGWIPSAVVIALVGGGTAVAIVGWLDDTKGLSPAVRLATHLAAAVWALFWLGYFPSARLGSTSPIAGVIAVVISLLALTWSISAYNFMDGIDALAGSEAVWVGAIGGLFAAITGNRDVAFIALLLSSASLGFLLWNLPPAKIFLGDIGSGFLGYSFAVLALFSERSGSLPAIAWLVLLGVFAFDSTVTLCRRLARREKWYVTHRESAYQRAALRFQRHGPVTAIVIAVDVVLATLCWIGLTRPGTWGLVVTSALVILVILYVLVERSAPVVRLT